MGTRDLRVDAYIANSAEFARPILTHLRQVVHAACPEVEETLKWSSPHFLYRGMLCGMAAFKAHCTFGFWKGSLIPALSDPARRTAMGHFGRLTSVSQLPPKRTLSGYIKEAMRLNEQGIKSPARKPKPRRRLTIPADFKAALRKNKPAGEVFKRFSPSHRREYVEWITEAKTEDTRRRRLATAVEWLSQGKPRNWKYLNC